MKIIWSDQAQEDLEIIYQNLAVINKKAAINLYNDILDRVEILLSFPTIAAVQLFDKDTEFQPRGLLTKNKTYKIVYFVDIENDNIYITQIWDCRRNPSNFKV